MEQSYIQTDGDRGSADMSDERARMEPGGDAGHDAAAERTLLIADDDAPFRQRLARAMESRGFIVRTAATAVAMLP